MRLNIIKLGGSVITKKKEGEPTIHKRILQSLCQEIADTQQKEDQYIILHGAGSFGHPLAYKYDLVNKPINTKRLEGMSKIIMSMQKLTNAVTKELLKNNLSAIPLQTSSISYDDNALKITGKEILEILLKNNGIPVLSGNVIVTKNGQISIVSADRLVVVLANMFNAKRILFVTDVNGVYKHFPPSNNDLPITQLTKANLPSFTNTTKDIKAKDVTGGMLGKLAELTKLKNVTVNIFNGNRQGNLSSVLSGKSIGTIIRL